MESMLGLMTDGEPPWSMETVSDPWPLQNSYTQSILGEPIDPLLSVWGSVSREPGGDDTQAFRPGTHDPTVSAALFSPTSARDNDGEAQSDAAPAANAAVSSTYEDIAWMNSMLEGFEGDCGEEIPETGRGEERPLSEDDNMFLSPGDPAVVQNSSPAPRVNSIRPSDVQVRLNLGAQPQPQPPWSYSPAQAPFGNFPATPHQSMPYTSMLYRPTPRPPMPYRSLPHPYSPYSTPGNTAAAPGPVPSQPSLAAPGHEITFNQLGNYGLASDASMRMNRTGSAATTYGSGPLQAPSYPQIPSQDSSEGRPQARTPAGTHNSIRLGTAAIESTTVYRNQVSAHPWLSPRASLPPNTDVPTQRRLLNREAAGSGSEGMEIRDPGLGHTSFPAPGGSYYRSPHPSQLGRPVGTFQPHHAITSQSHERPQRYAPRRHATTGSDTVIEENQQAMEQQIEKRGRDLFNERFPKYLRHKNLTEETCPPSQRMYLEALCETEARELHRKKQSSTRGPSSATSRQVEGTEPGQLETDVSGSEVPRVTTPDAERMRDSQPRMRHQPVLNVKVTALAFKIMARQRRGDPFTRLPGVTAEDIQEFRVQYKSMPALIWTRELPLPDDMVTATLQGIKLLGSSLTELWQLTQPSGPAQSAPGTQSASLSGSAQLHEKTLPEKTLPETTLPETTLPDDDGHVPEYLLDQFMATLELRGEQEALRFLRESKAKASQVSQISGPSRRKRSKAIMGLSDESLGNRGQLFTLDDIFDPRDDELDSGALAFGRMGSMGIDIDDDPAAFGIMEIRNARGQIMVSRSSKRRDNINSSPALNRTIDIHIEDDLVGAAESSTPVEKFRRLMDSSPTPKSPKQRARK